MEPDRRIAEADRPASAPRQRLCSVSASSRDGDAAASAPRILGKFEAHSRYTISKVLNLDVVKPLQVRNVPSRVFVDSFDLQCEFLVRIPGSRAFSNAQNSSKSGARSNELPPQELDGGHAFSRRTAPPIRQIGILPGFLGECGHREGTPVKAELHPAILQPARCTTPGSKRA